MYNKTIFFLSIMHFICQKIIIIRIIFFNLCYTILYDTHICINFFLLISEKKAYYTSSYKYTIPGKKKVSYKLHVTLSINYILNECDAQVGSGTSTDRNSWKFRYKKIRLQTIKNCSNTFIIKFIFSILKKVTFHYW